jgi:putative flippase GtrA
MPKSTHPRVRRSALVGAIATLTDLIVMIAAVEAAGLAPRAAAPFALAAGVVVQFLGNKLYAFRDRSPAWLSQAAKFLVVEAAGYAANVLLFAWLSRFVPVPYAALRVAIGSLVYFAVCLPLWSKIFVTRGEPRGVSS